MRAALSAVRACRVSVHDKSTVRLEPALCWCFLLSRSYVSQGCEEIQAPRPTQRLLQKPSVGDLFWEFALYARGSAGERREDLCGKAADSRHVKTVACEERFYSQGSCSLASLSGCQAIGSGSVREAARDKVIELLVLWMRLWCPTTSCSYSFWQLGRLIRDRDVAQTCLKEKAAELFQPLSMARPKSWMKQIAGWAQAQEQPHGPGLQGSFGADYLQAQFGSCQHLWERWI